MTLFSDNHNETVMRPISTTTTSSLLSSSRTMIRNYHPQQILPWDIRRRTMATDATNDKDKDESEPTTAVTDNETDDTQPEVETSTTSPDDDDTTPVEYTSEELTKDAALHKQGLSEDDRPDWQNPLHHDKYEKQGPPPTYPEDFTSSQDFDDAKVPAPPMSTGNPDADLELYPLYLRDLATEIVHLTVLEMNELTNKIAKHYGFDESMLSPNVVGGADGMELTGEGGDEDGAAAATEEKTAFDVQLVSFDASAKIKIIKHVRSLIQGLGLKEAKELVESAPKVLLKGVGKDQAEEYQTQLQELGATVELL